VLCGVSPLVWRRLLVVSTTSIAELHEILQKCLRLERRTSAPLAYPWHSLWNRIRAALAFRENARGMPLSRFRLHRGERFRYEYDFMADWKLDIRLERILPFDPDRVLPSCIGGSRAAPPEDCTGALDYLERLNWQRSHLPIDELRHHGRNHTAVS